MKEKTGGHSRRDFLKTAAVTLAAGMNATVPSMAWAGEGDVIGGIDARKLAAIKSEVLQDTTFTALAMHPCLEPDKSSKNAEKLAWAEVMSAVFPEGAEKLKAIGWVRFDESKGDHVFASDAPRLRLAAAHLFAIRGSEVGKSRLSMRQYAEFIGEVPLEEAYYAGKSPHKLVGVFFTNGGELGLIKGGFRSVDAQARRWEQSTGVKLRGGSTLPGVSIILSNLAPEMISPDSGGVRIAMTYLFQPAKTIADHAGSLIDVAMLKLAVRARFDALEEDKGTWQKAFYENLKEYLKTDEKFFAKIRALEVMDGRSAFSDEAFQEAVLEVVTDSMAADYFTPIVSYLNMVENFRLYWEAPIEHLYYDEKYPDYPRKPRTKENAAVSAVQVSKLIVVAAEIERPAPTGNAMMPKSGVFFPAPPEELTVAYRARKLKDVFLRESGIKPEVLAAVEDVLAGIYKAFGRREGEKLGQRRAEFLESLKERKAGPKVLMALKDALALKRRIDGLDRMAQQGEEASSKREVCMTNMAPLRRQEFVDSAYDGCLALEEVLLRGK